MTTINKDNAGKRVELIHTNDPHTKLKPGDRGTYEFELEQSNPFNNQHSIAWDNGSQLMMIQGDKWKFLKPTKRCCRTCNRLDRDIEDKPIYSDQDKTSGICRYEGYSEVNLDFRRSMKSCNAWEEFNGA